MDNGRKLFQINMYILLCSRKNQKKIFAKTLAIDSPKAREIKAKDKSTLEKCDFYQKDFLLSQQSLL